MAPFFKKLLVGTSVCAFLGAFFAAHTYLAYAYNGPPISWSMAFMLAMTNWVLWGLAAPIVLWLARRLPVERRKWVWTIPAHVVLAVVFAVAHMVLLVWLSPLVGHYKPNYTVAQGVRAYMTSRFNMEFLTYWGMVAIGTAVQYYRRLQERQLQTAQLETSLAQAQVQLLRAQMNPHFLFNTLHAISTLVYRDPSAADQMISRLSDLLRLSLESGSEPRITLAQELDLVNRYLEIEQIRFGERLQVERAIADDTLHADVPSMLLQPLVENAIKHGIGQRSAGGRVSLRAWRQNSDLRIELRDDGPGFRNGNGAARGFGLNNTRQRLAQMYPDRHVFELSNPPGGGAQVNIALPFTSSAPTEAQP
ncbi:MAG TPA: histidine kinase [Terriglobales bacterium]|nr:histidine kinase [Terriglobales bacterium]